MLVEANGGLYARVTVSLLSSILSPFPRINKTRRDDALGEPNLTNADGMWIYEYVERTGFLL